MVRGLRSRAWCLAIAACLSVGTVGASFAAMLHDDAHDVGCAPGLGALHDASAHRFRDASADVPDADHHCLGCHWARSFRLTSGSVQATARLAPSGYCHFVHEFEIAPGPARAHRSPRAPPASRLSLV